MGTYEDFGTRLGYAEENISTIKAELVTVAHSTNVFKPELNGMVAELVGANFGLKLFNMEKTIFDFQEWRDRQQGLASDTLKERIDRIIGPSVTSGGPVAGILGEHDKAIKAAQKTADEAKTAARAAGDSARTANSGLDSRVAGVQREGRAATTPVASVRDLRDAGQAINSLENRVNRLVAALS